MKNGKHPAFPIVNDDGIPSGLHHADSTSITGLTKFEFIATRILQGINAGGGLGTNKDKVRNAVEQTKLLLKEAEKGDWFD